MVRGGGRRRVLPSIRGLGAVYGEFGPADSGDFGVGQHRVEGGVIVLSQSFHLGQLFSLPLNLSLSLSSGLQPPRRHEARRQWSPPTSPFSLILNLSLSLSSCLQPPTSNL